MIGGSSGVGRALVGLLAERQEPVLATARDMRDLDALQRDCAVRLGGHVIVQAADIAAPDFDADAFLKECADRLGSITHLFLSVGAISEEDRGIPDDEELAYLTIVLVHAALFTRAPNASARNLDRSSGNYRRAWAGTRNA